MLGGFEQKIENTHEFYFRKQEGKGKEKMLSWEEFKEQSVLLVEDLKKHDNEGTWILETPRKYPERGNSMLRRMPQALNTSVLDQSIKEEHEAEDDNDNDDDVETFYDDDDDAIATPKVPSSNDTADARRILVEYSIVWSTTYQVPVLYFNLWEECGTKKSSFTAGVSEIVRSFERRVGIENDTNTIKMNALLSQGEHPLLGVSAWYLHPCKTANVMETIVPREQRSDYLKAWLALYGSFAGLKIDFL